LDPLELNAMQDSDLQALGEFSVEAQNPDELVQELKRLNANLQRRVNINADSVEKDLAKLLLGLIEFIRRLLERQAIRRVEGGGLTADQIENLGLALLKLESKVQELKGQFGLSDEDINLDLGPIGRLF
jgi:hypothetical protein